MTAPTAVQRRTIARALEQGYLCVASNGDAELVATYRAAAVKGGHVPIVAQYGRQIADAPAVVSVYTSSTNAVAVAAAVARLLNPTATVQQS